MTRSFILFSQHLRGGGEASRDFILILDWKGEGEDQQERLLYSLPYSPL